MSPDSVIAALVALLLALATCWGLTKLYGISAPAGRFASIDGLRGYLAFFVFLHHANIWFFFLRGREWGVVGSRLFYHFGRSSVALFFMITAFLFFSKLIDSRTKPLDWKKLYISRILRLVPLYILTMVLLFGIVAYLSGWRLHEPIKMLFKDGFRWLAFTAGGTPDLNGVRGTAYITGGVTWSLHYEWFFYVSLPLLAITAGARPPAASILFGLLSIISLRFWHPEFQIVATFIGGIAAAIMVKFDRFRTFSTTWLASVVVVATTGITITCFSDPFSIWPIILLSISFCLIACGNNLFGALTTPVARALGEISYSVYLLQGILLFSVFSIFIGVSRSKALSSTTHWLVIWAITPFLIVLCYLTYRLVERPGMALKRPSFSGPRPKKNSRI